MHAFGPEIRSGPLRFTYCTIENSGGALARVNCRRAATKGGGATTIRGGRFELEFSWGGSEPTAWLSTGKSCLGEALIMLEQPDKGIPPVREGMRDSQSMNMGSDIAVSMLGLAQGYASLGNPEQGTTILSEALGQTECTGERSGEVELYPKRAALQHMKGDQAAAEASLRKALDIARQQKARWWELRAATDLAHWWRKQGKAEEARQVVKEIYSWFSEGFDGPQLREARELCGPM